MVGSEDTWSIVVASSHWVVRYVVSPYFRSVEYRVAGIIPIYTAPYLIGSRPGLSRVRPPLRPGKDHQGSATGLILGECSDSSWCDSQAKPTFVVPSYPDSCNVFSPVRPYRPIYFVRICSEKWLGRPMATWKHNALHITVQSHPVVNHLLAVPLFTTSLDVPSYKRFTAIHSKQSVPSSLEYFSRIP